MQGTKCISFIDETSENVRHKVYFFHRRNKCAIDEIDEHGSKRYGRIKMYSTDEIGENGSKDTEGLFHR